MIEQSNERWPAGSQMVQMDVGFGKGVVDVLIDDLSYISLDFQLL